jgi:sulfite dehydrogenase (cytochrome) subunit B
LPPAVAGGKGIVKRILALTGVLGLALAGAPSSTTAAQAAPSVKKIELPPDNAMATLKPGPGVETVRTDCMICHSTDYIVRQPGGDAKHWEPEVRKMITVFGAPIPEADVQTIVNYLATAYGTEPAKPPSTAPPSSERPTGHEHAR